MITKILLILLLSSLTLQTCDIGCLKCNGSVQCQLCDNTHNYYLVAGTCRQSTVSYCEILANDGTCLQCKIGYYLDVNTGNCVAVPAANIIPSCKYYNASQACVRCNDDFFIDGAACSYVTNPVRSCVKYSADGQCTLCDRLTILNTDKSACIVRPTTTANCGGFTVVNCVQCGPGYIFNKSLYFSSFFDQDQNTSLLLSMQELYGGNLYDWTTVNICQPLNVSNCAIGSTVDICTSCKPGFYLDSNVCEVFTKTNCANPSPTSNVCLECVANYFLNAGGDCQIYTAPHCATLNPSLDECLTCVDNYFFNSVAKTCDLHTAANCAVKRKTANTCDGCVANAFGIAGDLCQLYTVTNCAVRNPTEDKCTNCLKNFYPVAFDCAAITATNCKVMSTTANECTSCPEGYYLNSADKFCIANTATDCLTRSIVDNVCLTCPFKYYLSAGNCLANTGADCLLYKDTADGCNTCPPNYYADGIDCLLNTATNCEVPSTTADTCTTCVAGYYLGTDFLCAENTSIQCAVKSLASNICTTCVGDHHIDTAVCTVDAAHCWEYAADKLTCTKCTDDYYLLSGACAENTVTNCLQKSATALECVICNAGFYKGTGNLCVANTATNCIALSETANECAPCALTHYLDSVTRICVLNPVAVANCEVYSSVTNCSKCAPDYLLASATSCTLITATISECATYDTTSATVICTSCISTHFLDSGACSVRTHNAITNCSAYSLTADKCTACDSSKLVTDDGLACLSAVTNCNAYAASTVASTALTCTGCIDTFFFNAGACDASLVPNCLTFSAATVCTKCASGFYLDGSICTAHGATPTDCSVLSITSQNSCDICNAGFHAYQINTVCETKTAILNCSSYDAAGTACTSCLGGFHPDATGANCEAYTGNCVSWDTVANLCNGCADSYVLLASTGVCYSPFAYTSDKCVVGSNLSFPADGSAESYCKSCDNGFLPVNLSKAFVCVEASHQAFLGYTAAVVVTSCRRYASGTAAKCVECDDTFYLSDLDAAAPTCEATCPGGSDSIVLDNLDGRGAGCITTLGALNCKYVARIDPADSTAAAYTCLEVNSNYIPLIVEPMVDNKLIPYEYLYDKKAIPTKAFYRGYKVTAAELTEGITNLVSPNPDDCELYYLTSVAFTYACYKAKWKYTAISSSTASSVVPIAECAETVYQGFPSYVNSILSCHKCTGYLNLFVEIDLVEGAASNWLLPRVDTASVTCSDRAAIFWECALHAIVYSASGFFIPSGTSTSERICLACKPGFTGVPDPTKQMRITECVAIENCNTAASNTFVNGCETCLSTPDYYTHGNTDFTSCVRATDNCYIASSSTNMDGVYYCAVCKSGYYLLDNGTCASFTIPGCSATTALFPSLTVANLPQYNLLKKLAGDHINGCKTCTAATDVMIQLADNVYNCNSVATIASATPIANCNQHKNTLFIGGTPKYRCSSCAATFIPTADYKLCITQIANCQIAQSVDQTKCQTCSNSYINVNGACVSQSISNCSTYQDTSAGSAILCATCNSGYSKNTASTACTSGTITSCKTYAVNSTTDCTACIDGYALLTIQGGAKQCLDLTTTVPNCLTFDLAATTGINNSIIKCLTCKADSSVVSIPALLSADTNYATIPHSTCLAHTTISGCTSYDATDALMANNSFDCLSCNASTYFTSTSPGSCTTRTVSASAANHCNSLSVTSDVCTQCAAGYYLNPAATQCLANPFKVDGCYNYSSSTTCTSCTAPKVLSSNACVASLNVVTNCAAYSADNVCAFCDATYNLDSPTSCVLITALNCKTYASHNACATCAGGWGLAAADASGIISCVNKGLTNCFESNSSAPFACTKCAYQYFIAADGTCEAPTTIANCRKYSSKTTCLACADTFVLHANTCVTPAVIANCRIFSDPLTCSACHYGFFLNANACTAVTAIANCLTFSSATACSACRGLYKLDTNVCYGNQAKSNCQTFDGVGACTACNTGYFNVAGVCTAPTAIPNCASYTNPTTCALCHTDYHLTANACAPNTLTSCKTFTDSATCTACQNEHYLSTIFCLVPSPLIDGCSVYSDNTTCTTCKTTHFKVLNTCVIITNTDPQCSALSSPSACSACNPTYFLKLGVCTLGEIVNCKTHTALTTCTECNSGFYLVSPSSCLANTIANCASHNNHLTCLVCAQGYVLTLDSLLCVNTYATYNDGNCLNAKLTADPFCSLCAPGFFFAADNSCTQCSSHTYDAGCFSCNPKDQTKCLLCKSGYFQNPDGVCILNAFATVPVLPPTPTPVVNTPVPVASTGTTTPTTSAPSSSDSTTTTSTSTSTGTSNTTNSTDTTNTNNQGDSTISSAGIFSVINLLSLLIIFSRVLA